ncbi:type VI secretion system protein TssA [Rhizobium halophytocola]|uniref:type VI secretion system protein TssA n=1 Tax=Rhizobium halophytocola TaxID=735519 RepID=UPI001AE58F80
MTTLTKPLDLGGNCGINIRHDEATRELYYKLKDERNQARAEERSTQPGEAFRLSQQWSNVHNQGLHLLTSVTRDIEVFAWLAESNLRLFGIAGLGEVYEATARILSNFWEDVHSIEADDLEERVAPLAGLNGMGAEGTIIQPIRLTSLIPGERFGHLSLWDYELAQRPGETARRESLEKAATEAGTDALTAHLADVTTCLQAFERLNDVLSQNCGELAPGSSNTRNVLLQFAAALRALGARDATGIEPDKGIPSPVQADGQPHPHPTEGQLTAAPSPAQQVSPEGIRSREEALELLKTVARYFRRTEPHSPISMAIETLVLRGRMDFAELLAELLPEQQARMSVLTAAGIRPMQDKPDKTQS